MQRGLGFQSVQQLHRQRPQQRLRLDAQHGPQRRRVQARLALAHRHVQMLAHGGQRMAGRIEVDAARIAGPDFVRDDQTQGEP